MDKPVEIPQPPAAQQRPHSYERHGVTIEDPWHWLRDPKYPNVDDPDVLAYLHAENDYFEGWKKQHEGLIDVRCDEFAGDDTALIERCRNPTFGADSRSGPRQPHMGFQAPEGA